MISLKPNAMLSQKELIAFSLSRELGEESMLDDPRKQLRKLPQ